MEVIIKTRERKARGPAEIADGCALEAAIGENHRGMMKNMLKFGLGIARKWSAYYHVERSFRSVTRTPHAVNMLSTYEILPNDKFFSESCPYLRSSKKLTGGHRIVLCYFNGGAHPSYHRSRDLRSRIP